MSKEEIFENAFERAKIKYPNENWKSWDAIVYTTDGRYGIKVRVHSRSDTSGLTQWIDLPKVDIPVKKDETKVAVRKRGAPFWMWVLVVLEGICIVALIFRR